MTQREKQILDLIAANPMISQQELADSLNITRSSVAVHISNLLKKGYIAGKGYVLRTGSYAVVVGGVNVDIGGCSFAPLVDADSNPGKVSISLGGVGRNIAHNMSLMGLEVRQPHCCFLYRAGYRCQPCTACTGLRDFYLPLHCRRNR